MPLIQDINKSNINKEFKNNLMILKQKKVLNNKESNY